jgi:hypothetical protein
VEGWERWSDRGLHLFCRYDNSLGRIELKDESRMRLSFEEWARVSCKSIWKDVARIRKLQIQAPFLYIQRVAALGNWCSTAAAWNRH